MAPGACHVDARRGRCRGTRAFGGASPGTRWIRCCRRLPRALFRADARPCSSGRPGARGSSGEVRGRRVRRGTHAGCERGGGPVGRSPACGAGSPPRAHLIRRGTRERVTEAAPRGREGLPAVRRSTGPPDLSRRPVCRPVRGSSGGFVWCSRGRSRREIPPPSRIAARRGGPVARRTGPDDHRGSLERHAGAARGLARILERRRRRG